ncbi:DUF5074 domain-containing protein [Elizabethkingia meningoseptica]|uniref:DUF5074 domain-containing protein n=2 Tax=Elizabethkingia meningoseptica TaxID=238 RepID=A0A1T3I9X9_ELIME|nr:MULTISPECIES: DUF5074 domain-containing protein [Elizabethkingia]AQX11453.1 DUF5074 domain-containing protein [Elizabethkingia meningoseptica]MBG0512800.1 DUF5074 domain-containing protein [Elizabethkingia meningoseptica]MDE5435402.1 DUF5074 domain-containing protein [Elizabethkingia meningoseptica]MDE5471957.1 DUF5074 domain-containing protein [Elizabethkingia meningoseptica]MDE5483249.1 DUF5074 domain-containing protein [Elizabethkingia meningoseptica]
MRKTFISLALPLLGLLVVSSCSNDDNFTEQVDPDTTLAVEDSAPAAAIASQGFYVANEDWFGHDNGSVNYFKNDGSITYRAYRAANNGEKFGVTTQFATIYGDNAYFISKQGNRLVVADAKTLKKKAVLTEIGGDGRSFVGINAKKGYIATSKGISIFNIETMALDGTIADVTGQTGNMLLVGNYVFAITQSKGAYVINTKTNTVEKLITGTDFAMLTQSKDGKIWIGANKKLIQIDPYTLEKTDEVDITNAPITGTWGAWTAGSLSASTKQNVLYWTKGATVVKYDINAKTLNPSFYALGKDDEGVQLAFYGAALRVDPLTDKLVLLVKRNGWGAAGSYNWLHIVSNVGALEKNIVVNGDNGSGGTWGTQDGRYFWFPAIPFFEDANAPQILLNQVILPPNKRKAIALNDKIVDADNTSSSIIKSINFKDTELAGYELKQDSLIVTAKAATGKTKLTISALSNGKYVEKEIRIDVRK